MPPQDLAISIQRDIDRVVQTLNCQDLSSRTTIEICKTRSDDVEILDKREVTSSARRLRLQASLLNHLYLKEVMP